MRNRITIALGTIMLVAATVFVAPTVSFAQDGDGAKAGKRHGRMGRGFGRMFRNLDLTEEQKQQIRTILENERATNEPLHQQLRSSHEALQQATANGQFDESQVRELVAAQERIRTELTVSRLRVKSQIYNVLTPEQRQQIDEKRNKFDGHRGKRKGLGQ